MTSGSQGLPSDDIRHMTVERSAAPIVATRPAPEVNPVVDIFAMLSVIGRRLDRFVLAVAERAEFYESGARR